MRAGRGTPVAVRRSTRPLRDLPTAPVPASPGPDEAIHRPRPENRSMQVVRAAGGVIMRDGSLGESELLIVHRPRYDDWTLPKGKAERGESDEACALREVEEETSLVCDLETEVA